MNKVAEYFIVSDFDGTITVEDSTVELVNTYGNADNNRIEEEFINGLISNREAMALHFELMDIDLSDYYKVIDKNIHIDKFFSTFLSYVRKSKTPLHIVSGGFVQGIKRLLGTKQTKDIQICANKLIGDKHIRASFVTKQPVCDKPFGPCGNCKREYMHVVNQQSGRVVVYIGDGLTDRCAIDGAHIVFAKNTLASYCDANDLDYVPFKDFADITKYLWPLKN